MKITCCLLVGYLLWSLDVPPKKVTTWKLVQHWSTSNSCIDTVNTESWHRNEQVVNSINFTYNKKAEFLEEVNKQIIFYDLLLNNRKKTIKKSTCYGGNIDAYYVSTGDKARGKIVKRTDKLLFLSWVPGSVDVYQNISQKKDSVSIKDIDKYIIESGRLFGKKISYCN
jgi:hypothetical protein